MTKIVSVPYGDLFYFYAERIPSQAEQIAEFPSPLGFFFISIQYWHDYKFIKEKFPSPLGFFFTSILGKKVLVVDLDGQFPSPMGGFFISINNMAKNCTIAEFFPSPMENFFISMLELETNGNLEDIEFPFPMGIFFVSIKEGALYAKGTDSFRPLRGSFLFL